MPNQVSGNPLGWILEYTVAHPQLANSSTLYACSSLASMAQKDEELIDSKLSKLLVITTGIRSLIRQLDERTTHPDWCPKLARFLAKIERRRLISTESLLKEDIPDDQKTIVREDSFRLAKLYDNILKMMNQKSDEERNEFESYRKILNGFQLGVGTRGYLYEQLYDQDEVDSQIEALFVSTDILTVQLTETISKYLDTSLARIFRSEEYREVTVGVRDDYEGDLLSKTALSRIIRIISEDKGTDF